jgi:hypothetical protein
MTELPRAADHDGGSIVTMCVRPDFGVCCNTQADSSVIPKYSSRSWRCVKRVSNLAPFAVVIRLLYSRELMLPESFISLS